MTKQTRLCNCVNHRHNSSTSSQICIYSSLCSCCADVTACFDFFPPSRSESSTLSLRDVVTSSSILLSLSASPPSPPSQAQLIAQSIGQAFSMAYQEFLRANGINPKDLSQKDYSDILSTQEMYNDDLIHFSNSENCKEVITALETSS